MWLQNYTVSKEIQLYIFMFADDCVSLPCADVEVGVTYEVLLLACTSAGCTSWEDKDWPWARITIPYHIAPGVNCSVAYSVL